MCQTLQDIAGAELLCVLTAIMPPTRGAAHARRMEIYKRFRFEAAHRLPHLPEGHKCARLHGHSFTLCVHVAGDVDERLGWVCDFARITEAFEPLHAQLDHRYLNEVEGLSNPTSENIARWIWQRLAPRLPGLAQLVVEETCTSGCVYRGEGPSRDELMANAG